MKHGVTIRANWHEVFIRLDLVFGLERVNWALVVDMHEALAKVGKEPSFPQRFAAEARKYEAERGSVDGAVSDAKAYLDEAITYGRAHRNG